MYIYRVYRLNPIFGVRILLWKFSIQWRHLICDLYNISTIEIGFLWIKIKYFKSTRTLFLKLCAKKYSLRLSSELLFIIIGQGAAKLWPFIVGSPKTIWPWTDSNPILHSKWETSKAIVSDLQLCQATVLQPLDLL